MFTNTNQYWVWGAANHPSDEDYNVPPPREIPRKGDKWPGKYGDIDLWQRTGGRRPIVCADVVALSYERGGLNLYGFTDWAQGKEWTTDPTRNVGALGALLQRFGQEHQWDGGTGALPQLGDMVLSEDYGHSGVVAEKTGNDGNHIFVVQTSYLFSPGLITKMTLASWRSATESKYINFGHPGELN
jgi:hypothetical protein